MLRDFSRLGTRASSTVPLVAATSILLGALLGAPVTVAAGAYGYRHREGRKVRAAARAVSWSFAAVQQGVAPAKRGDWRLLATAGDELERDWADYGDALRSNLPGPVWREIEDTVRASIRVKNDIQSGDLDHRGNSKQWLSRLDQHLIGSIGRLQPFLGTARERKSGF
jgi:hypothetical protein